MGCIPPVDGFLKGLRKLCDKHNILLIFDEVMTGFRVAKGGAQELYGVSADIVCFGKIIGGGLPVGAFASTNKIMSYLSPNGPVYQAGTLSGNPVAVAAGLKTLELIQRPHFFTKLSAITSNLVQGLMASAQQKNIDFCARHVGGMFGMYFSKKAPDSFDEIMQSDRDAFKKFFHLMLNEGIYFGPSAFEAGFVSAVHSEEDIKLTLKAADKAFNAL